MLSKAYNDKADNVEPNNAQRYYGIDLLRIVCAVAVVLIHVCSAPITANGNAADVQVKENLIQFHNLLNWSVPCFYMITGYCLQKKDACSFAYCFKHVRKFILCLMTVGFAQAMIEEIYIHRMIDVSVLLLSVGRVIEGRLWDHMWYVYSILGIYLVMPVIHSFIRSSETNAKVLTGVLFMFSVLFPALEPWVSLGIDLPLGDYLFYVCIGAVVAIYPLSNISKGLAYALGLVSFVYVVMAASDTICGYTEPTICFMAIAVFLLISSVNMENKRRITTLAKCTWGVYVLHPFFINCIIKLLKIDLLCSYPYAKLAVFAMVTIIASFGVTYALRKIPFGRAIL